MRKALVVIVVAAVLAAVIGLAPVLGNRSSLLRKCKFNEASGAYDKCFWRWDPALQQPSIYF